MFTFRNEHRAYRLPEFPNDLLTKIVFSVISVYVFGECFKQLVCPCRPENLKYLKLSGTFR